MKIHKAYALIVQPIQIRGLDDRITVTRDVAITLIVGKNKDDIGLTHRAVAKGERRGERRYQVASCDAHSISESAWAATGVVITGA